MDNKSSAPGEGSPSLSRFGRALKPKVSPDYCDIDELFAHKSKHGSPQKPRQIPTLQVKSITKITPSDAATNFGINKIASPRQVRITHKHLTGPPEQPIDFEKGIKMTNLMKVLINAPKKNDENEPKRAAHREPKKTAEKEIKRVAEKRATDNEIKKTAELQLQKKLAQKAKILKKIQVDELNRKLRTAHDPKPWRDLPSSTQEKNVEIGKVDTTSKSLQEEVPDDEDDVIDLDDWLPKQKIPTPHSKYKIVVQSNDLIVPACKPPPKFKILEDIILKNPHSALGKPNMSEAVLNEDEEDEREVFSIGYPNNEGILVDESGNAIEEIIYDTAQPNILGLNLDSDSASSQDDMNIISYPVDFIGEETVVSSESYCDMAEESTGGDEEVVFTTNEGVEDSEVLILIDKEEDLNIGANEGDVILETSKEDGQENNYNLQINQQELSNVGGEMIVLDENMVDQLGDSYIILEDLDEKGDQLEQIAILDSELKGDLEEGTQYILQCTTSDGVQEIIIDDQSKTVEEEASTSSKIESEKLLDMTKLPALKDIRYIPAEELRNLKGLKKFSAEKLVNLTEALKGKEEELVENDESTVAEKRRATGRRRAGSEKHEPEELKSPERRSDKIHRSPGRPRKFAKSPETVKESEIIKTPSGRRGRKPGEIKSPERFETKTSTQKVDEINSLESSNEEIIKTPGRRGRKPAVKMTYEKNVSPRKAKLTKENIDIKIKEWKPPNAKDLEKNLIEEYLEELETDSEDEETFEEKKSTRSNRKIEDAAPIKSPKMSEGRRKSIKNTVTEKTVSLLRSEKNSLLSSEKASLSSTEKAPPMLRSEKAPSMLSSEKASSMLRSEKAPSMLSSEKTSLLRSEKASSLLRSEKAPFMLSSEKTSLFRSEKASPLLRSEKAPSMLSSEKASSILCSEKAPSLLHSEKASSSLSKKTEDGNDSSNKSMEEFFRELEEEVNETPVGKIASTFGIYENSQKANKSKNKDESLPVSIDTGKLCGSKYFDIDSFHEEVDTKGEKSSSVIRKSSRNLGIKESDILEEIAKCEDSIIKTRTPDRDTLSNREDYLKKGDVKSPKSASRNVSPDKFTKSANREISNPTNRDASPEKPYRSVSHDISHEKPRNTKLEISQENIELSLGKITEISKRSKNFAEKSLEKRGKSPKKNESRNQNEVKGDFFNEAAVEKRKSLRHSHIEDGNFESKSKKESPSYKKHVESKQESLQHSDVEDTISELGSKSPSKKHLESKSYHMEDTKLGKSPSRKNLDSKKETSPSKKYDPKEESSSSKKCDSKRESSPSKKFDSKEESSPSKKFDSEEEFSPWKKYDPKEESSSSKKCDSKQESSLSKKFDSKEESSPSKKYDSKEESFPWKKYGSKEESSSSKNYDSKRESSPSKKFDSKQKSLRYSHVEDANLELVGKSPRRSNKEEKNLILEAKSPTKKLVESSKPSNYSFKAVAEELIEDKELMEGEIEDALMESPVWVNEVVEENEAAKELEARNEDVFSSKSEDSENLFFLSPQKRTYSRKSKKSDLQENFGKDTTVYQKSGNETLKNDGKKAAEERDGSLLSSTKGNRRSLLLSPSSKQADEPFKSSDDFDSMEDEESFDPKTNEVSTKSRRSKSHDLDDFDPNRDESLDLKTNEVSTKSRRHSPKPNNQNKNLDDFDSIEDKPMKSSLFASPKSRDLNNPINETFASKMNEILDMKMKEVSSKSKRRSLLLSPKSLDSETHEAPMKNKRRSLLLSPKIEGDSSDSEINEASMKNELLTAKFNKISDDVGKGSSFDSKMNEVLDSKMKEVSLKIKRRSLPKGNESNKNSEDLSSNKKMGDLDENNSKFNESNLCEKVNEVETDRNKLNQNEEAIDDFDGQMGNEGEGSSFLNEEKLDETLQESCKTEKEVKEKRKSSRLSIKENEQKSSSGKEEEKVAGKKKFVDISPSNEKKLKGSLDLGEVVAEGRKTRSQTDDQKIPETQKQIPGSSKSEPKEGDVVSKKTKPSLKQTNINTSLNQSDTNTSLKQTNTNTNFNQTKTNPNLKHTNTNASPKQANTNDLEKNEECINEAKTKKKSRSRSRGEARTNKDGVQNEEIVSSSGNVGEKNDVLEGDETIDAEEENEVDEVRKNRKSLSKRLARKDQRIGEEIEASNEVSESISEIEAEEVDVRKTRKSTSKQLARNDQKIGEESAASNEIQANKGTEKKTRNASEDRHKKKTRSSLKLDEEKEVKNEDEYVRKLRNRNEEKDASEKTKSRNNKGPDGESVSKIETNQVEAVDSRKNRKSTSKQLAKFSQSSISKHEILDEASTASSPKKLVKSHDGVEDERVSKKPLEESPNKDEKVPKIFIKKITRASLKQEYVSSFEGNDKEGVADEKEGGKLSAVQKQEKVGNKMHKFDEGKGRRENPDDTNISNKEDDGGKVEKLKKEIPGKEVEIMSNEEDGGEKVEKIRNEVSRKEVEKMSNKDNEEGKVDENVKKGISRKEVEKISNKEDEEGKVEKVKKEVSRKGVEKMSNKERGGGKVEKAKKEEDDKSNISSMEDSDEDIKVFRKKTRLSLKLEEENKEKRKNDNEAKPTMKIPASIKKQSKVEGEDNLDEIFAKGNGIEIMVEAGQSEIFEEKSLNTVKELSIKLVDIDRNKFDIETEKSSEESESDERIEKKRKRMKRSCNSEKRRSTRLKQLNSDDSAEDKEAASKRDREKSDDSDEDEHAMSEKKSDDPVEDERVSPLKKSAKSLDAVEDKRFSPVKKSAKSHDRVEDKRISSHREKSRDPDEDERISPMKKSVKSRDRVEDNQDSSLDRVEDEQASPVKKSGKSRDPVEDVQISPVKKSVKSRDSVEDEQISPMKKSVKSRDRVEDNREKSRDLSKDELVSPVKKSARSHDRVEDKQVSPAKAPQKSDDPVEEKRATRIVEIKNASSTKSRDKSEDNQKNINLKESVKKIGKKPKHKTKASLSDDEKDEFEYYNELVAAIKSKDKPAEKQLEESEVSDSESEEEISSKSEEEVSKTKELELSTPSRKSFRHLEKNIALTEKKVPTEDRKRKRLESSSEDEYCTPSVRKSVSNKTDETSEAVEKPDCDENLTQTNKSLREFESVYSPGGKRLVVRIKNLVDLVKPEVRKKMKKKPSKKKKIEYDSGFLEKRRSQRVSELKPVCYKETSKSSSETPPIKTPVIRRSSLKDIMDDVEIIKRSLLESSRNEPKIEQSEVIQQNDEKRLINDNASEINQQNDKKCQINENSSEIIVMEEIVTSQTDDEDLQEHVISEIVPGPQEKLTQSVADEPEPKVEKIFEEEKPTTHDENAQFFDMLLRTPIKKEVDCDEEDVEAKINLEDPVVQIKTEIKVEEIDPMENQCFRELYDFNDGDLAYAKLGSYPYWPCMIAREPHTDIIMSFRMNKLRYHVRFFGDRGRRSWVKQEFLLPLLSRDDLNQLYDSTKAKGAPKKMYNQYRLTMAPKLQEMWNIGMDEALGLLDKTTEERYDFFFEMFASEKEKREKRKELSKLKIKEEPPEEEADFFTKRVKKSVSPIKSVAGDENEGDSRRTRRKRKRDSDYEPPSECMDKPKRKRIMEETEEESINDSPGKLLRKIKVGNEEASLESSKESPRKLLRKKVRKDYDEITISGTSTPEIKSKSYLSQLDLSSEASLSDTDSSSRWSVRTPIVYTNESQSALYKRNSLFKGVLKDKVCQKCLKPGEIYKCRGKCYGYYHKECSLIKIKVEVMDEEENSDCEILTVTHKKYQPPKNLSLSVDKKFREMSLAEQIDFKLKELMAPIISKTVYADLTSDTSSEDSSSEKGSDLTIQHVTADDVILVNKNKKKKNKSEEDFKCTMCVSNMDPDCFVCGQGTSPITGNNFRQKCCINACGKFYHLECLKVWPQTQISLHSTSTPGLDSFYCPMHTCHICVSDNPRASISRLPPMKIVRCLRCPATYHSNTCCIPAGTEILSTTQIICPRHSQAKSGKHDIINTKWCFICSEGGDLICCETCPTSVHIECSQLNLKADETFICEECETGRLPLYDEIVWVKLRRYRWWPALILFPNEIPDNVRNLPHEHGDFVVKIFGTHEHYWVNRGRVFLFQEGDEGPGGSKNKVDLIFKKAIEEAAEAHIFKSEFKKSMGESMKMSDKPPPYIRIKVNKPVGNVKQFDGNVSNTTPCNCDPNSKNPCGPDSYCINRLLMTECDPEVCPARDKCQNQKFEKREYPPLTPHKTEGRGWGLKTLAPIKKGQFVIEYVGELIDDQEYQRRIAKMHEQKDDNYYFLTIEPNRMIDAGPRGNLARFMNHCCEPNCETQKWTVKGETRVGLFAKMDIPADSEVTFNYNLESAGDQKKICMCGAQSCSGFIGVKVKNTNDEKKLKKPSKMGRKKRSPTPVTPAVNMEPCYLCGGDGETFPCHNKICTKYYHLKCAKLDAKPDGKWSCPWHNCNICSKRTIRCCVKCINSYCPIHSEGNVRHDKLLGFICTEHDPTKEPQEILSIVKKSRNPTTLTEESDVTSTTHEEIEEPPAEISSSDITDTKHDDSVSESCENPDSETKEKKKRGRRRKNFAHKQLKIEPQKNPNILPNITTPEIILTSSVPERHLRTNRKVSSEDSESERLLKRQQAYEKALPMRKRTTPRTESTEN